MAGKRRKKRRGFWAWLTGRKPREEPPSGGGGESALPAPPEAPAARAAGKPSPDRPCPACGGTDFRWGWLEAGLYGAGKGSAPEAHPAYVRKKTRFGDFLGLQARVCADCGHVELFARREQE
jgi:hypothetical protein